MTERCAAIADFIAKKVGDRLKSLYNEQRDEYIQSWQDVGTFVKFGSLNDDKFKKQVEDIIIYRTTYEPGVQENKEVAQASNTETPAVQVQSEEGDAWQDVTQHQPANPNSQLLTPNSPTLNTPPSKSI
jgi:molecular chaperone HtpG